MFKIIWSDEAVEEYNKTVEFWQEKNGNSTYSLKIIENVEILEIKICEYPLVGVKTRYKNTLKVLFLEYFALYYRISESEGMIEILEFWDGRRNPADLIL